VRSVFILATILVAAPTHWMIYRWAVYAFPRLHRRRRLLAALLAVVVVAQAPARIFALRQHGGPLAILHGFLFAELIIVAIAAIPISLVRIGTWIAAGAKRDEGRAKPNDAEAPKTMTRRQIVEAAAGAGFLGATGSMLGWGIVRGRHAFVIEEVPLRVPGLPRVLDGYTIAQISDIHGGMYVGERELSEGLARVEEARADLLVVTGDLVDFDSWYAAMVAKKLAGARARDGVVAILGNHDYYAGAAKVVKSVREAGVSALVNSGMHMRANDGGGFALLGVDDVWGPRRGGAGPILAHAISMVPKDAPRVLLSHQPSSVDLWAGQVAVQLSGHTHGGQINPGFVPAKLIFQYVAGKYDVRGTTLYVNRGFGTVGPPSRIGAPPEVTKIVLVSA
jgi:predicted MPP superfamily phosphohydrolase